MKLKNIEIKGFKSYGSLEEPVQFGDLNIIIGPNGVGKSNLIAFLEMISFIATDGLGEYVASNGYASSLIDARRGKIDLIGGN